MHSILIVDDEDIICRGLKALIERISFNWVRDINFITNPYYLYNAIKKNNPDIIMTDIKMPGKSGLDIIKESSAMDNAIKYIVLSGYNDFEYVKDAFKLGAVDYLLKPVSKEELKDVLEKTARIIDNEKEKQVEEENKLKAYKRLTLENNLNKIIMGTYDLNGDSIENLLFSFKFRNFAVGLINVLDLSTKNTPTSTMLSTLEDSELLFDDLYYYTFLDASNDIVVLFNLKDSTNNDSIIRSFGKILNKLANMSITECFAGLGQIVQNLNDIHLSYKQARHALRYKIVHGANKIIEYNKINTIKREKKKFDVYFAKFNQYLLSYDAIKANEMIDILFSQDNMNDMSLEDMKKTYDSILHNINNILLGQGISDYNVEYNDFYNFNHMSDIRIYLKTEIVDAISLMKNSHNNKSICDKAKKYIHDNISRDIDMVMVSNMVSVSYSHFSKIFKDETGMTFSEYILKVKMEKAMEMLSDNTNKIQDIAVAVGYNNAKNFTRAFKNYFGFPPMHYKNRV